MLRSFGPRFRVGRLLATTPTVSVADAVALAARARRGTSGSTGRIDAEDEFEDDAPPAARAAAGPGSSGATGGPGRPSRIGRETVPFEVREGLDAIAIDADALDDGLVVVPRESVGTAADLPDRVPAGTVDPSTPVRLLIEQVSSVEHAIVLGVPTRGPDGLPRMAAGLGRPLILTHARAGRGDAHPRRRARAARWRPRLRFGGRLRAHHASALAWAVIDAVL